MGDDDPIVAAKARARTQAMLRRRGQDPALGAALAAHVLRDCPPPPGAVVAGYWPMGDEIDIRPLLGAVHERGNPVCLPITPRRGQPLHFALWHPGMALLPETFGTARPTGAPAVPDLLFVPLLAFDRAGRRLGYSGGFYDRTLAALPRARAIGCAFAAQELDEVPANAYDARLHAIATERGVLFCER